VRWDYQVPAWPLFTAGASSSQYKVWDPSFLNKLDQNDEIRVAIALGLRAAE